jgi:hypothetical protein
MVARPPLNGYWECARLRSGMSLGVLTGELRPRLASVITRPLREAHGEKQATHRPGRLQRCLWVPDCRWCGAKRRGLMGQGQERTVSVRSAVVLTTSVIVP